MLRCSSGFSLVMEQQISSAKNGDGAGPPHPRPRRVCPEEEAVQAGALPAAVSCLKVKGMWS